MVEEGKKAPGFKLQGSDEKTHSLAEFKGKPLVIYFYPRDDTPGCTREACDFTANLAAIHRAGAEVVGVSPDTVAAHQKFIAKYKLKHLLLSDSDKAMATEWGVFREKVLYGKKSLGIVRSTFILDAKGVVIRAYDKVRVDGHVEKVILELKSVSA